VVEVAVGVDHHVKPEPFRLQRLQQVFAADAGVDQGGGPGPLVRQDVGVALHRRQHEGLDDHDRSWVRPPGGGKLLRVGNPD